MTTTPDFTGKGLHELDALIAAAISAKQQLYDEKIEALLARLEQDCNELDITPKQLLAALNKRKRKTRTHRDDGVSDQ